MKLNKTRRQLREYKLRMEGKKNYEKELVILIKKHKTPTIQLRIRYLTNKISRM